MPQARIREGKRYRYFRETGTRIKKTRLGDVEEIVGEFVYAEEGEVIEVATSSLKGARDFLERVDEVEPIGEQDEPYSDTEAVLDGQWQHVCKRVLDIDDPDLLVALREAEKSGRVRGSVLDAIDEARDECDDDDGKSNESEDE